MEEEGLPKKFKRLSIFEELEKSPDLEKPQSSLSLKFTEFTPSGKVPQ